MLHKKGLKMLPKEEVETLTPTQERIVNALMAKEFLRNRLGIKATKENVDRFVEHLVAFEKEVRKMELPCVKNQPMKKNLILCCCR